MSDDTSTPTPNTRIKRRQGKRLNKKERSLVQATFLRSFADTANVRLSCEIAGIDRSTFYQWSEHDEAFSLAYHQAELDANDALMQAAWQRAVEGIEEPLVSMGQMVYEYEPVLDEEGNQKFDNKGKPMMRRVAPITKRVYSDTVLLRLMSYRIPGFKESAGTTINNVNVISERNEVYANMRDDELDQLESLWNKAQERLNRGGN